MRQLHTIKRKMRVMRTTHELCIWTGVQAANLLEAVKNLPPCSRIVDITQDDSDGAYIITFEEERPET